MQDLLDLETLLHDTLKPVLPRANFLRELRAQLSMQVRGSPVDRIRKWVQYATITLAGMLTITLVILAGVRAVVALLGALGIAHQVNRQLREKTSLRPAR